MISFLQKIFSKKEDGMKVISVEIAVQSPLSRFFSKEPEPRYEDEED